MDCFDADALIYAGRIDYQFNDAYRGTRGDPHSVVFIRAINLSSH
jgi:hypothetical protein